MPARRPNGLTAPARGATLPARACRLQTMAPMALMALMCLAAVIGPVLRPCFAASSGEPIRIAAIYAETGEPSVGTAGQDFRGAALAVEAVNASGGLLGRRVELVTFDNAGTPLGARQAALRAVEAGVTAVVGGPWSGMTVAMAEVCQKARVPFVASIATHPDVTRTGEWIFRVCYTDDQQGELLARFARTGLSAATAAILVNVGSSYSQGLAATFSRAFTAAGGRIVSEQPFKTNDTDFAAQLAAVADAAPDVVFLPSYALESGHIVRQAASLGITATFLGGDGWGPAMADTGRAAVNGHFYTTHWHPDVPLAAGRDIAQAYRKAHGRDPVQPDAILAHDAVMVLADAVRRAGSLDRDMIREALARTRDVQGGTGSITFDPGRNPLDKEVCIMRFENGQAVFFSSFR